MPEITDSSTIKKTEDFVETLVDGEIVLMHLDDGRFFGLKDTGRHFWELLNHHQKFSTLVSETMKEYDVTAETCQAELAELLFQLKERKLVTVI